MISIIETNFLHSDKNDTFVVTVREYTLFGIWCYKREEKHSYNQRLISEYTIPKEIKSKPIGFISYNKKKRKNENKSKVS